MRYLSPRADKLPVLVRLLPGRALAILAVTAVAVLCRDGYGLLWIYWLHLYNNKRDNLQLLCSHRL